MAYFVQVIGAPVRVSPTAFVVTWELRMDDAPVEYVPPSFTTSLQFPVDMPAADWQKDILRTLRKQWDAAIAAATAGDKLWTAQRIAALTDYEHRPSGLVGRP